MKWRWNESCICWEKWEWERFYEQTVEFHRKNAASWLNVTLGEDVSTQIDPDFSMAIRIRESNRQSALL